MRTPLLIVIVDDNPPNVDILQAQHAANNYGIIIAPDGVEGLAVPRNCTLLKYTLIAFYLQKHAIFFDVPKEVTSWFG